MQRSSSISRETNETNINLSINLDGEGQTKIKTDVPFMNHMLDLFGHHGQFDLTVDAQGDTDVDAHHTTEDMGICLGKALHQAIGDKKGINRYGNAFVPMDETLVQAVIDLSDRPHLEMRAYFPHQKVGSFDTELVHEFMWKLALEARMNLHIIVHYGRNTHHIIEGIFKALARALNEATAVQSKMKGVPSTKGLL
ncbi:imidazoleglycerol-phosphate dehydratase HisB [Hazenella sp. IB182357]|uniref:Imidazoleglycerol-phosphate dehydratase n=1 Tax=Polycladospora coralii TaxID=2771432 RepID=A0A926NG66_9BACL|nr:imidazoleglycerol-phosphate dehydratase HisB [Polycladospora coralii]MBD1372738.1 imidazoleglycerol-phosphate dehydratase HisB [Polycladospora coralii]